MKLVTLLTRVAVLGFAAFLAAVALNAAALVSFSLAAAAFLALIAAHDYAPRPARRVAIAATMIDFPVAPARTETPARLAA